MDPLLPFIIQPSLMIDKRKCESAGEDHGSSSAFIIQSSLMTDSRRESAS